MNKHELSSHLKQATESIDDILKAAKLPLDLPDYSPEQVKALEEIVKLVEDKQAKTYKEAGGLYRKPLNEAQLQEIAARHSQTDRIPEIVTALKLKSGNITDEQFEQFREVCEQVQQGIELPIAAQGVLNKAKAVKAKPVPEFVPQSEPERSHSHLIAPVQTGTMANVPEEYRESATKAADNLSQVATQGLSERTMNAAEESVVKGWEVIPKAIAAKVESDMLQHVQSEQFAATVVNGVIERLKQRGLL